MRHDIIRRRTFTLVLLATLLIASAVRAQAVDDQTPPPPQAEKPSMLPVQPPPPPPPPVGLANVKMDITITDQAGAAKPIVKTISVIVADRANNQIRSQVVMPVATRRRIPARDSRTGEEVVDPQWRTEDLPLNIDLRAEIIDASRVRMRLVLNYRTVTESTTLDGQPARTSVVTEEVSTILDSGKPTMISQSADAATDRKVTVEVKATIQK
jgi:hypothetical protein